MMDKCYRIGRQAENKVEFIEFDIAGIEEKFGAGGTWFILCRRPTEITGYPVPYSHFEKSGNKLKWTITATETAYSGNGEVQLSYIINDIVKMSKIYALHIERSLTTGEAPSEIEMWLSELEEIADRTKTASEEAKEASEAIQNMDVIANTLPSTLPASVEKIVDPVTGEVLLKFGIPKGADGSIAMVIVQELPETGEPNTIYLVPSDDPKTGNLYDEYIYANGHWERIGGMSIDLSNYLTKTEASSTYIPKRADENTIIGSASSIYFGDYVRLVSGADVVIEGQEGVSINTGEGKKATYNGSELATVDDIPNPPTKSTLTIATTDWAALADSSPYTYSATKALTIADGSTIELINDNAVLFATHGFAIGYATTTEVTIYSVGVPTASVSLKVEVYK